MLKKKIKSISTKKKSISAMEGSRSYISKKVISKSGNYVGKVYDTVFAGNILTGIVVMRRLSRIFIDKEFFKVSDDAVMLSIDPVISLQGKRVFDADGKKIGKVSKVIRKGNSNTLEAIMVKKNIYSKAVKVSKTDIDVSKKNIILKKVYE